MTIENRRSHHAFSQAFQLEEAVLMAVIYAKATRPTRPAIMANAGLLLLLAAPVKVATGAVVAATGVTEEYHTLLAVVAATGVEAGGGGGGATELVATGAELHCTQLLAVGVLSTGAGAGTYEVATVVEAGAGARAEDQETHVADETETGVTGVLSTGTGAEELSQAAQEEL